MGKDSNAEQERLKRLRDQQLASRDPQQELRRYHQQAAQRGRQAYKMPSLRESWGDIPHIWKNLIFSLVVGVLAVVIVPAVWPSSYALLCAGAGTLIVLVFGTVVGRAMDSRDEIRRLTK